MGGEQESFCHQFQAKVWGRVKVNPYNPGGGVGPDPALMQRSATTAGGSEILLPPKTPLRYKSVWLARKGRARKLRNPTLRLRCTRPASD